MSVAKNQDENDFLIFNYDDEVIKKSLNGKITAKQSAFSLSAEVADKFESGACLNSSKKLVYFYYLGEENIIDAQNLIFKGQHNIFNSLASIITAKVFGIKRDSRQQPRVGEVHVAQAHSYGGIVKPRRTGDGPRADAPPVAERIRQMATFAPRRSAFWKT